MRGTSRPEPRPRHSGFGTAPIGSRRPERRPACTAARRRDGRAESAEERADRNVAELLQELRVAALGIQVLFGFLLALPFDTRFALLVAWQQQLYLATVVMAPLATALLTAPVAYHRVVFRGHEKARLVAVANALALAGLGAVGVAITMAVLFVTSVVERGWEVPTLAALVAGFIVTLWVVLPIAGRLLGPDGSAEGHARRQDAAPGTAGHGHPGQGGRR